MRKRVCLAIVIIGFQRRDVIRQFVGSMLKVFAHDTSAPKAATEKEAPKQVLIKNVNIFDGQNVLLEGNLKNELPRSRAARYQKNKKIIDQKIHVNMSFRQPACR
jgi:hypothetical protein